MNDNTYDIYYYDQDTRKVICADGWDRHKNVVTFYNWTKKTTTKDNVTVSGIKSKVAVIHLKKMWFRKNET